MGNLAALVSSALPDLDNWSVCDNLAMFGVGQ